MLGEAEKAKLQKEAENLKTQYQKQLSEYEKAVPQDVREQRKVAVKQKKAGKPLKDPAAPKKPLSAFMIFSNSIREKIRAENPGGSFCTCLSAHVFLVTLAHKDINSKTRRWCCKGACGGTVGCSEVR